LRAGVTSKAALVSRLETSMTVCVKIKSCILRALRYRMQSHIEYLIPDSASVQGIMIIASRVYAFLDSKTQMRRMREWTYLGAEKYSEVIGK